MMYDLVYIILAACFDTLTENCPSTKLVIFFFAFTILFPRNKNPKNKSKLLIPSTGNDESGPEKNFIGLNQQHQRFLKKPKKRGDSSVA